MNGNCGLELARGDPAIGEQLRRRFLDGFEGAQVANIGALDGVATGGLGGGPSGSQVASSMLSESMRFRI